MATPTHDKYYLRSLHEEIDLFDRKLAHLTKYGAAQDEAGTVSAQKMAAKRELLARTARELVSAGIEFKPSELPRSFRAPGLAPDATETVATSEEIEEPAASPAQKVRQFPSAFHGTILDSRSSLQEYKQHRAKAAARKPA